MMPDVDISLNFRLVSFPLFKEALKYACFVVKRVYFFYSSILLLINVLCVVFFLFVKKQG